MTGTTGVQRPDQLSVRVIEAIAETAGTEMVDLQPPLYDVIDPGALNRLFTGEKDASVTFEYRDHVVTVFGDGTIVVDDDVYEAD